MNKVYGGTTRGDAPDLCETCRNCTVVRGHGQREVIKRCNQTGPIPFRVYECKNHLARGQMFPYEMEKIAWVLDLDKGKRVVGFLDPEKRGRQTEGGNMPMPSPHYPGDPFK